MTSGSPLGLAEQLRLAVLSANDRMLGLGLDHVAVDGCTIKAPAAARPPAPVRWTGASSAASARSPSRRRVACRCPRCPPRPTTTGDRLLAATLDDLTTTVPLPERLTVHLDAGYDYQPCRQVLAAWGMAGQIATRGVPAPIQADRRWVIERTHAWGS